MNDIQVFLLLSFCTVHTIMKVLATQVDFSTQMTSV